MEFSDEKLYACGQEGGGVAGYVRWDQELSVITWFQPGGRQRAYDVVEVVENSADQFAFIDYERRKFVLFPLTVDYYNQHVRLSGHPSYTTQAAMMYAYQQSLA